MTDFRSVIDNLETSKEHEILKAPDGLKQCMSFCLKNIENKEVLEAKMGMLVGLFQEGYENCVFELKGQQEELLRRKEWSMTQYDSVVENLVVEISTLSTKAEIKQFGKKNFKFDMDDPVHQKSVEEFQVKYDVVRRSGEDLAHKMQLVEYRISQCQKTIQREQVKGDQLCCEYYVIKRQQIKQKKNKQRQQQQEREIHQLKQQQQQLQTKIKITKLKQQLQATIIPTDQLLLDNEDEEKGQLLIDEERSEEEESNSSDREFIDDFTHDRMTR
jgi:hypothetical protein